MKLIDHFIDLTGPGCFGKYARPEGVGRVLACITPMIRETVRMSILHSSRRVGRPMTELKEVWDVRFGGQAAGPDDSTRLMFKAPTLKDAAPKLFDQEMLWADGPEPGQTAFDLVGAVLKDVANKKRESQRYDVDLLNRIRRFDAALDKGVLKIQVGGHLLQQIGAPAIDQELTEAARSLVMDTPAPRRVRIAGRLDMIRVSDRMFELVLKDGHRARAVWAQQAVVELREYLGADVTIEGQAVFRPSGSLLRIEAEAIANAGASDDHFSVIPRPSLGVRRQLDISRPGQRGDSPFSAIYGQWPGEESEEEMLAKLEEIS